MIRKVGRICRIGENCNMCQIVCTCRRNNGYSWYTGLMEKIRKARRDEAKTLTRISYSSKHYWEYPESCFDIWQPELTITGEYIDKNDVWVYEDVGVVAYYSIVTLKSNIRIDGGVLEKGTWLDHMFVLPEYIGKSIGAQLYSHMCGFYSTQNREEINILADPHARGFYEKMGCIYVKEIPSTIPERTTPLLKQKLPVEVP